MFLGIYSPAWFNILMMIVALVSIFFSIRIINRIEENKPVPKMAMTAVILHIILLVANLGLFANSMIHQAEVQHLKTKEMVIESVQN